MNWDLKLEKEKDSWVLHKYRGAIPAGNPCEWRKLNALLQDWLVGSGDLEFAEIMKDVPTILKESKFLTPEHKLLIGDRIIDAIFLKRLSPEWEDVLCETLKTLLFTVLPQLHADEKSVQNELHYTLRRWVALVKDPTRTWFERTGYSRDDAMQKAVFDSKTGQIYPFYSRQGFPVIARDIARWFVIHYDLVTCARIDSELYRIEGEKLRWSMVLQWPKRFVYSQAWRWNLGLVACVSMMSVGVLLPLLCTDVIGAPTAPALIICGTLAFVLLYLVPAPPDLMLLKMLGAIGVGYVVLLITGDVWKFAFLIWHGPSKVHAWSILTVSLMASFLYVLAEMHDSVYSWCQRVKRTSLILTIGLGQSLVVGIGACLLAGSVFSEKVIKMQETLPNYAKFQLYFQWGSTDFAVYPEMVIFFAPVALFVGIFAQILWEEEEITSPL